MMKPNHVSYLFKFTSIAVFPFCSFLVEMQLDYVLLMFRPRNANTHVGCI